MYDRWVQLFTMRFFLTIFILGLTLVSCSDMPTDKELDLKLKTKILSGVDKFYMSELTNFKWDSLLILKPYSVPDRIEDKFDIDLSMVKYTGIDYGDNTNVLLFLYQGEVINMVDFDRYPGDFSKNDVEMIPESRAVFGITVTDQKNVNGDHWIEVNKVK
jgi:hypothetical protein